MIYRQIASLLLVLCFVNTSYAQSPISEDVLKRASERGALLFALDQAAWYGSDALVANVADPIGEGVRGYVVDVAVGALEVVFFGEVNGNKVEVFAAQFVNGAIVSADFIEAKDRKPLSPIHQAMIRARAAAMGQDLKYCVDRPFNTVVIPPKTVDDPIDVYLLTPQVANETLPLGRHYKFTVETDGRVSGQRAFSNSCLDMPLQAEGDSTMAGFSFTHLLDDHPMETHVFSSLYAPFPIILLTVPNNQIWELDNGQISWLSELEPQ